jgi:hypothetical protein
MIHGCLAADTGVHLGVVVEPVQTNSR